MTGSLKELCTVSQIRRNFIILMIILSVSSFCFFCINFQMKNVQGSIITNTLASQSSELVADLVGGIIYFKIGARLSFTMAYIFSIAGSILLIFAINA